MALQDRIDQDIKTAMLARDEARLRGLRAIKAAILLARAEKGPGAALTEEAEIKVLQKLALPSQKPVSDRMRAGVPRRTYDRAPWDNTID